MKIWEPADIGSVVSFPRRNSRTRDYFRVMGLPKCDVCKGDGKALSASGDVELITCSKCGGSGKMVDLQALSKEDAAAEQAKQDRMDHLGELCWHYYGVKEGLVRYGVQIKRRGDPMVVYDRLLAAAYEQRTILDG